MDRDKITLLVLMALSIVAVYLIPALKTPFFALCLFFFYFSKRDYVWILFLFIFLQNPGYLFIYRQGWIVSITQTVGIPFEFTFALVALAKVVPRLRSRTFWGFTKAPMLIFLYVVVLIILSALIGMNTKSYYTLAMYLAAHSLFISIPILVGSSDQFNGLVRLGYFAIIVLSALQIIDTLMPVKFFQMLGVSFSADPMWGQTTDLALDIRESREAIRVVYGPYLSLFSLTTAFHYLLGNDRRYSKNYLSLIIVVSIVSVFMTATRGWILAYAFMLIIMGIITNASTSRVFFTGIVMISVMLIVSPLIRKQTSLVIQRVLTVNEYIEGDKSAGGTLQRMTVRAPRVYGKFKENPITGFGYSKEGLEYNDGHVGNHNILLEGGILGTAIYILAVLLIILKVSGQVVRGLLTPKQFGALLAVFGALLIIHSSSAQIFGYLIYDERNYFLILLLLFITRIVFNMDAKKYDFQYNIDSN